MGTPKNNNRQILAMAAVYGDSVSSNTTTTKRSAGLSKLRSMLSPLPAAQDEVKGLEASFIGNFITGQDANETSFKQKAGDYAVIHLAMHGLLDKKNPILSSLAFTENNDSLQDNFLQAHEISHLKLNADLVVLSACETGYGKFEQGEGVMSLARSFMYAGVPALVVSMWEVNDASTAKIMQFFYHNLASGQDKAEALRQAKLQYLSESKGQSAHPAYWSAFVQLGDNSPISIQRKGGAWWWWLGGGDSAVGHSWCGVAEKEKGSGLKSLKYDYLGN